MSGIASYSVTPSSNNSAPPSGWPEGMAPSTVNDVGRQMMADIATWYAAMVANRVAFNAQRSSSAQIMGQNAITDIAFNAENFDIGNNYAGSTGIFTAPVSGLYSFQASINLQPAGTAAVMNSVYFSKNNTTTFSAGSRFEVGVGIVSSPYSNTGNSVWFAGACLMQLTAGDTVRVKWDAGGSSSGVNNCGITSAFSGFLVNPG